MSDGFVLRDYSCLFDLRIFWIYPDFKKIISDD
jgi:hypothetical protein